MFLLHAVPTPPAHQPRGRVEPAAGERLATGAPGGPGNARARHKLACERRDVSAAGCARAARRRRPGAAAGSAGAAGRAGSAAASAAGRPPAAATAFARDRTGAIKRAGGACRGGAG